MASPSEAEIQDQIGKALKAYNEFRKFGDLNASNWVGLEDAFVQAQEGDFSSQATTAIDGTRARISGALTSDALNVLGPLIQTYGIFMAAPETDVQAIFSRIYDRFVATAQTVKSRVYTFGSPAAGGGNVGNGAILRLNKDENAFDIETQFPDSKVATVISDQNSGTNKNEEVLEFRAGAPGKDAVQLRGSGAIRQLVGWSANNARTLANCSFTNYTGTLAAPTGVDSWTASPAIAGANNAVVESDTYRSDASDGGTPRALLIKATQVITQTIKLNQVSIDPNVPMMLQLAWRRDSAAASAPASGTLVLKMGTKTATVVAAAQTGWQTLRVGLSSSDGWYKNFKQQDLVITIDWTRTGGDLLVDEVLLVPGTAFDNSWYWCVGGTTPWLLNDVFTWSDSEVGSILQYWFWRLLGRYLPHAAAGNTWAEP